MTTPAPKAAWLALSDARAAQPEAGRASAKCFTHGSMEVRFYQPRSVDAQVPHDRDELYVVASGSGWFWVEGERRGFKPGDTLVHATPQTVTATARNDTVIDGNRAVSVSALVTSTDTAYNNLPLTQLSLVTADDDTVNWIVVDTTGDVAAGNTSSLAARYDARGADGLISLREAFLVIREAQKGLILDFPR